MFKDLTLILYNLFHRVEKRTLLHSIFEASILLISKPDKNNTKAENIKVLNKIPAGGIQQYITMILYYDQMGYSFPRDVKAGSVFKNQSV